MVQHDEKYYDLIHDSILGQSSSPQGEFLPLNVIDEVLSETNLVEMFPNGRIGSSSPIPKKIFERARKVFAILLEIGEAARIDELLSEDITDDDLPLQENVPRGKILVSNDRRKTFKSFEKWGGPRRSDFYSKQWIVLAPVFDPTADVICLDRLCPLPFPKMEELTYGHAGVVYRGELHQAHYRGRKKYKGDIKVAIKEFRKVDDFNREKDNLNKTQEIENKHLIKHLAMFERDRNYFIIFPWADGGDLLNIWKEDDSKRARNTELVLWSLRQMYYLAKGLEDLHKNKIRHGDLKPANIFYFTNDGEERLVIADVGISRRHEKDTFYRDAETNTKATTRSYEAPETVTGTGKARPRRYDIWSLGCILLEFTIWLLYDFGAIECFNTARVTPNNEFYLINNGSAELHETVNQILQFLQNDPRCQGSTALDAVLKLIANNLLQVEVRRRDSAEEVVQKLQKIVQDTEANLKYAFCDMPSAPPKFPFTKKATHVDVTTEGAR